MYSIPKMQNSPIHNPSALLTQVRISNNLHWEFLRFTAAMHGLPYCIDTCGGDVIKTRVQVLNVPGLIQSQYSVIAPSH